MKKEKELMRRIELFCFSQIFLGFFRCVPWSGEQEEWLERVAWRKRFSAGQAGLPGTTRSSIMGIG